jgi:hypothetical protein
VLTVCAVSRATRSRRSARRTPTTRVRPPPLLRRILPHLVSSRLHWPRALDGLPAPQSAASTFVFRARSTPVRAQPRLRDLVLYVLHLHLCLPVFVCRAVGDEQSNVLISCLHVVCVCPNAITLWATGHMSRAPLRRLLASWPPRRSSCTSCRLFNALCCVASHL